jgi:S1-C subfamily serine protease
MTKGWRLVGLIPILEEGNNVIDDDDVNDEVPPTAIARRRFLLSLWMLLSLLLSLLLLSLNVNRALALSLTYNVVKVPVSPQANAAITLTFTAIACGGPIAPSGIAMCTDSAKERRIAIFEQVLPLEVCIDTFSKRWDALSSNVLEVPSGLGSGFIWDKDGHIVTNFHVVQEARLARVAILTPTGRGGAAGS